MTKTVLLLLAAASTALGQTPAKDTDTLQALLGEVRQLRQDIESMTVASQRVQITLHALQLQDTAVARAVQRLDEARNRRLQAEDNRQHMSLDVKRFEDAISAGKISDQELKAAQARVEEMKGQMDRVAADVVSWQTAEADAMSQLRIEQAKLDELQARIDRIDKVLENLGK